MSKTSKILIIKLGALGDVLRTTPLLRVLDGDICWVTKKESLPILPAGSPFLGEAVEAGEALNKLSKRDFDLVLSLDDDPAAARLSSLLNKKALIGSFLDPSGRVAYTDSAAAWFDMGLVSKFGKQKADALKGKNRQTYQEILFRIAGKDFNGEEYILDFEEGPVEKKAGEGLLVGIESRADKRWPSKCWNKYELLADRLRSRGLQVKFFTQRETLGEYIKDISGCDLIVTGDTLAMHLGLALKIKVAAIFTCTSPQEIYGYGRLVKVVSPLLEKAFYRQEYVPEAVEAVSLDAVYQAALSLAGDKR